MSPNEHPFLCCSVRYLVHRYTEVTHTEEYLGHGILIFSSNKSEVWAVVEVGTMMRTMKGSQREEVSGYGDEVLKVNLLLANLSINQSGAFVYPFFILQILLMVHPFSVSWDYLLPGSVV